MEWRQPRAPSRSRSPPLPPLHAWVEDAVEDVGEKVGNDDGDGEHDDDRDRAGEIVTRDCVVCVGSDAGPLEDRLITTVPERSTPAVIPRIVTVEMSEFRSACL